MVDTREKLLLLGVLKKLTVDPSSLKVRLAISQCRQPKNLVKTTKLFKRLINMICPPDTPVRRAILHAF